MKLTKVRALSALLLPLVAANEDFKPPIKSEAIQELITEKGCVNRLEGHI